MDNVYNFLIERRGTQHCQGLSGLRISWSLRCRQHGIKNWEFIIHKWFKNRQYEATLILSTTIMVPYYFIIYIYIPLLYLQYNIQD